MIQQSIIQKIVEAIEAERALFAGSDNQFAKKLGISNSQYSNIKNGKTDRQLAESKWIRLARELGVQFGNLPAWKTANTRVFQMLSAQLEHCQRTSTSALLCDLSDIGKSYTAQYYCNPHTPHSYCASSFRYREKRVVCKRQNQVRIL